MDVRQISNQKKYDLAASSYDFIACLMSLGQANRLYDELADCFDLPPDATIVELGCGPASVIPSLLKKIPSKTAVIGIDFSEQGHKGDRLLYVTIIADKRNRSIS